MCGAEGFQGVYGSIRVSDMIKLLSKLFAQVKDMRECVFTDVGCGIGRVLAIAWAAFGVDELYGLEIDELKV